MSEKRGRKAHEKCDRDNAIAQTVVMYDRLTARQAVRDAALKELEDEFQSRKAEIEAEYNPDLSELNKAVAKVAAPLRADWGDEHQVPADLGGGTLLIERLGEQRGTFIRFVQRSALQS